MQPLAPERGISTASLGAMAADMTSTLVGIATIVLVIFFLTPSRFLHAIQYGVAGLLVAFVIGATSPDFMSDPWFWGPLLFGSACIAYWTYGKLSRPRNSDEKNS